jgi:hypothetical protein
LEEIRLIPLDRMTTEDIDTVDAVVDRVLPADAELVSVDVALFNSAI